MNLVVKTVSTVLMLLFVHNVSMDLVLIKMALVLDALSIAVAVILKELLTVLLAMKDLCL